MYKIQSEKKFTKSLANQDKFRTKSVKIIDKPISQSSTLQPLKKKSNHYQKYLSILQQPNQTKLYYRIFNIDKFTQPHIQFNYYAHFKANHMLKQIQLWNQAMKDKLLENNPDSQILSKNMMNCQMYQGTGTHKNIEEMRQIEKLSRVFESVYALLLETMKVSNEKKQTEIDKIYKFFIKWVRTSNQKQSSHEKSSLSQPKAKQKLYKSNNSFIADAIKFSSNCQIHSLCTKSLEKVKTVFKTTQNQIKHQAQNFIRNANRRKSLMINQQMHRKQILSKNLCFKDPQTKPKSIYLKIDNKQNDCNQVKANLISSKQPKSTEKFLQDIMGNRLIDPLLYSQPQKKGKPTKASNQTSKQLKTSKKVPLNQKSNLQ